KVRAGKYGAARAERLHSNPDKFLATVQIGITLFGTIAGVLGGATIVETLARAFEQAPIPFVARAATLLSVGLVSVAITVTSVVVGELVPKYLALSYPERYARYVAGPISIFTWLTSSVAALLSGAARLALRPFGITRHVTRPMITKEEVNLMIYDGRQKGIFDDTEERLIKSVFDFADSTVRRALTPRTDVIGIELHTPPDKVIDTIIEHGYSRYPVYDGTIDRIVGFLLTKDLIHHKLNPHLIILADIIRPTLFIPDSMPLSRLLHEFQQKRLQFAVVLDEFGGTAGIVTLEDVLEELVGEIQDEHDTAGPSLVRHSESVAFASGSVWPGDINELMSSHLPEETADTIAGLVIDELGRLPEKNETVRIADMFITILEQKHRRLRRLKLEKMVSTGSE
ncbi:MAG TPA: hemolysin family protein, partial [Candidatus Deferrimicrobium sp.]|nr:hemolysin family protein [Candidatus Deferrimicrobium sp.]